MFELFTPSAIDVVLFAHNEALWSGHESMLIDDILLGLAAQIDTTAGRLLQSTGVTVDRVRSLKLSEQQIRMVPLADLKRELSLSGEASAALQTAFDEAVRRNDDEVNCGHILFAVIRSTPGQQLLSELKINSQMLEQRLVERLSQPSIAVSLSHVQRKIRTAARQISVWRHREQTWRNLRNYDLAFQAMVVKGTWVAELHELTNGSS